MKVNQSDFLPLSKILKQLHTTNKDAAPLSRSAGAHLDSSTNRPPHPGPLPLRGGEGEDAENRAPRGCSPSPPSEGERAGVRGPVAGLSILPGCARSISHSVRPPGYKFLSLFCGLTLSFLILCPETSLAQGALTNGWMHTG